MEKNITYINNTEMHVKHVQSNVVDWCEIFMGNIKAANLQIVY